MNQNLWNSKNCRKGVQCKHLVGFIYKWRQRWEILVVVFAFPPPSSPSSPIPPSTLSALPPPAPTPFLLHLFPLLTSFLLFTPSNYSPQRPLRLPYLSYLPQPPNHLPSSTFLNSIPRHFVHNVNFGRSLSPHPICLTSFTDDSSAF